MRQTMSPPVPRQRRNHPADLATTQPQAPPRLIARPLSDASTRESIWSVSRETKTYYFILFSLQVLLGLGLIFRETGAVLAT